MKITIEMTQEEYDSYRAYQKKKESLEHEATLHLTNLRREHEKLANSVLDSVEQCGEDDEPPKYRIKNDTSMCEAVTLANDWYC
ncbi:hypothetical protein OBV_19930 [Oscillibacter valericigenes Sjm18-20]|nr:hypothetical protein OBV_19930 [Oscillibacter valericigenes Sjm18-20]